jgi:NAD(P)-dependent dehydrogenase (short-subunit alcohol dehydrogenase family)
MTMKSALIVGTGPGLSASLARLFTKHGLQVALASRNPDKLAKLAEETAAFTFACEATEPEEVAGLFDAVVATIGTPDIVVYNASARARGPVTSIRRMSRGRSRSARMAASWWRNRRLG